MRYSVGNVFKTPDTAEARLSDMKCPHCENKLLQLGYLEGPFLPGQREWIGENLYRCQSCPTGKNRFIKMGTGLMQETPKTNANRVDTAVRGSEMAESEQTA